MYCCNCHVFSLLLSDFLEGRSSCRVSFLSLQLKKRSFVFNFYCLSSYNQEATVCLDFFLWVLTIKKQLCVFSLLSEFLQLRSNCSRSFIPFSKFVLQLRSNYVSLWNEKRMKTHSCFLQLWSTCWQCIVVWLLCSRKMHMWLLLMITRMCQKMMRRLWRRQLLTSPSVLLLRLEVGISSCIQG